MLEVARFSRDQAETSIKILVEIMEDKLAGKQDIVDLKKEVIELKQYLGTSPWKQDLFELRSGTKQDLLQLKHDLTLKLGAMLSAAVAIVAALHKFT